MKTLYRINQGIQLLFILLIVAICLVAVGDAGVLFYAMYLAIPLGAYQLGLSFAHFIYHQTKSKYTVHLVISILYLILLWVGMEHRHDLGLDIPYEIAVVPPVLLAVYSFYLSFTPFQVKEE